MHQRKKSNTCIQCNQLNRIRNQHYTETHAYVSVNNILSLSLSLSLYIYISLHLSSFDSLSHLLPCQPSSTRKNTYTLSLSLLCSLPLYLYLYFHLSPFLSLYLTPNIHIISPYIYIYLSIYLSVSSSLYPLSLTLSPSLPYHSPSLCPPFSLYSFYLPPLLSLSNK